MEPERIIVRKGKKMEKTEQEWNEFAYKNVPIVAALTDLYKISSSDTSSIIYQV